MPVFQDQLNRAITLSGTPKRIISVVPSQTELLIYLGLDAEITGISKFCIHPSEIVRSKIKIGGTKNLNIPLIKSLQPDLIIANKEENDQAQVRELMSSFPVWVSDINNLASALKMINCIGELVGRKSEANRLLHNISRRFDHLQPSPGMRVAYLIWRKPYMVAGNDTYINAMLEICGFINVFNKGRYPAVTALDLADAAPDVLLLSSEPYPFASKHIAEFQQLLPYSRIQLADGEMFSWYGSRLLDAPAYFNRLIENLQ